MSIAEAALLTLALLVAAVGAMVARFTGLRPLAAAALVAIVPALLVVAATAGFLADGPAFFGMALVSYLGAGALAAPGAFLGWLRRSQLERAD